MNLHKPRGLSFTAAKQAANAIDSLVAPRPISPLMGRPSNFDRVHKDYQRLFMVYDDNIETYLIDGDT